MHIKEDRHSHKIHISHIMNYISAYEINHQTIADLESSINEALKKAKETTKIQIVNQDGECCLHITPTGYIFLMLPWKKYKVAED